ncbi:12709_t:CDS:1, partial [Racocetra fulgida]
DILSEIIISENTAPEDITLPADTITATQDNYNQALYEFHAMQVKRVHEKVVQNDETY